MNRKILIGTLIVLLTTTAAAAQKEFKLMGEPRQGSKFKQVDAVSPIPFDKTYEQLNEVQKAAFRATYGGLADNEKPPFPVEGTQSIYKPIIKGHKEIARAGTLFLVAMIDENGKVENVSVYESPHAKMTEYASTVLFNTEFEPATCNGKPCKMEFPFEFKLRTIERSNNR